MIGVHKQGKKWVAQHKKRRRLCDTEKEAIEQRLTWENQFGKPSWGSIPDDLTGEIFGYLKVIEYAGSHSLGKKKQGALWLCENIVTGEIKNYRADQLKAGLVNGKTNKANLDKARAALEDTAVDGVQLARFTDKPRSDNTTGFRGVSPYRGGYRARLTVKGKVYQKGPFKTVEEACYYRKQLEEKYLPKKQHWQLPVLFLNAGEQ